uniref:Uncharacterized protein n=1 Tax=Junco hyemalis TaxID=40217 RepID=A0A8C5JLC8_JUNHY
MGTSTCVLPTFRSQVPAKSWITPCLQCKVCSGRAASVWSCPWQGHCLPAEMSLSAVTALLLLWRTHPATRRATHSFLWQCLCLDLRVLGAVGHICFTAAESQNSLQERTGLFIGQSPTALDYTALALGLAARGEHGFKGY